jgi:hypothetical protein
MSTIILRRITLISSICLLTIAVTTIALTGHATWLLDKYFPGGAWYIWKGLDVTTYSEQQTPQQWVTVDYNPTTERLTFLRAALGVVAGILGVMTAWGRDMEEQVYSHTHMMKERVCADGFRRLKLAYIAHRPFICPPSLPPA